MSKITGNEPKHWHDENGRHCMPDPRRLAEPLPVIRGGVATGEMSTPPSKADICHGDPDMRLYWDHLDAHDQQREIPTRRSDDSPEVSALFDVIDNSEQQIATCRRLIGEMRP